MRFDYFDRQRSSWHTLVSMNAQSKPKTVLFFFSSIRFEYAFMIFCTFCILFNLMKHRFNMNEWIFIFYLQSVIMLIDPTILRFIWLCCCSYNSVFLFHYLFLDKQFLLLCCYCRFVFITFYVYLYWIVYYVSAFSLSTFDDVFHSVSIFEQYYCNSHWNREKL